MKRATTLLHAAPTAGTPVTRLDSNPATLDFPTDFSRSSVTPRSRGSRERVLSPALFERIHSLRSGSSVTAEDWLLAACASLIYRYASSDDFAIRRLPVSSFPNGRSESSHPGDLGGALRCQLREHTGASALAEAISMLTQSSDGVPDALLETAVPPSRLPIQVGFVHSSETELGVRNESNSIDDYVAHHWHPKSELQITFGMSHRSAHRLSDISLAS
jgi:hypothetical protein